MTADTSHGRDCKVAAAILEMDAHGPVTLEAGGFAVMQCRTAHQFSCLGDTPCLMVVTFDRPHDIFWVK